MAKKSGKSAAATSEAKKKKPAATAKRTVKAARKAPAAKKPAVKKVAAKKTVVKKAVTRKVATKAKKPGTVVKTVARKTASRKTAAVRPEARVAKKAATRARRRAGAVLEVSPLVIDTAAAAEVAARLVVDAPHAPHHEGAQSLGDVFELPPVVAVKRGSSALRHVKESLHKPVAAQLDSVFGPPALAPRALRGFVKGAKAARNQQVRGASNTHLGQSNVPHRSVG